MRLNYSILLILTALISTMSRAKEPSAEARVLGRALISMGYEDIRANGCLLEFSKSIKPTDDNNGFFAYTRLINLNNFSDFETSEIRRVGSGSAEVFVLSSGFNDRYTEAYKKVFEFRFWVKTKFGTFLWPYQHPKEQDQNTPLIEYYLTSFFRSSSEMNRWIDYSNYGASTHFPSEFTILDESKSALTELKASIIAYSKISECDIEWKGEGGKTG